MSETRKGSFSGVKLPEGHQLKRKEIFEYTTQSTVYDVELFEQQDGTFYAIGVPRDATRLVVYGSNIVDSAEKAMQILVDKIRREGVDVLFHQSPSTDTDEE